MSEETTAVSDSLSTDSLSDGFAEVAYWITVARDSFDLARFRAALPASKRDSDDSEVSASHKDGVRGGYHVHFAWNVEANRVRFRIEYYKGGIPTAPGETEPYAAEFMRWLGTFFSSDTVACHVHANFEYPLATRQTIVPISVEGDLPCGATLSGVALRLPPAPNGVLSVKWTQGESHWYAEVVATRTINFNTYTPHEDASALDAVLAMFLKESTS